MIFIKLVVFVILCYVCLLAMEFIFNRVGEHYLDNVNKLKPGEQDVFILKCVSVVSIVCVIIGAAGCYIVHLLTPWFLS